MLSDMIDNIKTEAEELSTLWKNFYTSFLVESDDNAWLPKDIEIAERTIPEFNGFMLAITSLLARLPDDAKSLSLVPTESITKIDESLTKANAWLNSLIKAAKNNAGGGSSYDNLKTDRQYTDKQPIPFSRLLTEVFPPYIDTTLAEVHKILVITKKLKISVFRESQGRINAIVEQLTDFVDKKQNDITAFLEDNQAKIKDIADDAGTTLERIEEMESQSQKILEAMQAFNNTMESSYSSLPTEAEELEGQIAAYSAKFAKFDADLKVRDEIYTKLSLHLAKQKTEIDELCDFSKETSVEIERLSKEADKLLQGSTNAALAASFNDLMESSGKSLAQSEIEHNDSLKMLLIVVCLVTSIFTGLLIFQKISLSQPTSWVYIILAVLPVSAALLRVSHTGNRHNSLFRLHEDYAYKYSIARAVEGYKKQAPQYKEEIAAATFFEIAFNPADNADLKDPKRRKSKDAKGKFFNSLLVKFGFKNEELDGLALICKTATSSMYDTLKKIPSLQTQFSADLLKKVGDAVANTITEILVAKNDDEEDEA